MWRLLWRVVLGVLIVCSAAGQGQAGYTYTVMADTDPGSPHAWLGPLLSLPAAGKVAFVAGLKNGETALLVTDGVTTEIVLASALPLPDWAPAYTTRAFPVLPALTVSPNGQHLAVLVHLAGGVQNEVIRQYYVRRDGAPLSTMVPLGGPDSNRGEPLVLSVNDDGEVLYRTLQGQDIDELLLDTGTAVPEVLLTSSFSAG